MKLLRTISTARLVTLVAIVAVIGAGSAALALAAGGGGATPPPEPLATAIHDAIAAQKPAGIDAKVTFTNNLFPSGSLMGTVGSALLSGAHGRLWATADGRGRLELQSDAGDVQIVWNQQKLWAYDASSNTVYALALPQHPSAGASSTDTVPGISEISSFLSKLSADATVSGAQPDNVGSQPAYTVSVSPKHDGGLLGSAQLAFAAANGVPLRFAVYARGSSAPALALEATDISFGAVDPAVVDISPPADAHVVQLSAPAGGAAAHASSSTADTLPAVQAALDFPVVAPLSLGGLAREHIGLAGHDAAIAVYGKGLGAVVVVERKADPGTSGPLGALPSVSIDGVTGHELATQLGTIVEWQSNGRSTTVAGSVPPAAAEAAARSLK